jgi:hypothetical protein
MKHATKNTHGCCDGNGQVHVVACDDPYYEGPLSSVRLCLDPACMARREAEWAQMCREDPS